jgi:hypothetical protein
MTTTLTIGDEFRRLDNRLDDLTDKIATADETAAVEQIAASVETQLSGVAHLREEYGPDATVEIESHTAGDIARIEDEIAKRQEQRGQSTLPGTRMNLFVAAGLVDAPFLDADADHDETLVTVADQPVGVVRWLRARINEETTVSEGNWKSLDERLADQSEG